MKALNVIIKGIALVIVLFAGQTLAATDGTLSTTSTGTSLVSLSVGTGVQISSVNDIALGAYSGTGNLSGQSTYCVHKVGGTNYQITLTTDQASFQVFSATTTDTIAFSVLVDDDIDASVGGAAIAYNTASGSLVGHTAANCGGNDNAAMQVSFIEANLQAVSSANDYQATVTMLVEPI